MFTPGHWLLNLAALSALLHITHAADCNTDQPRKAGDPSGQDITNALRGSDGEQIIYVCDGGFPPGNPSISTFNVGSLVFNVTRTDPTKSLQHCQAAFEDIVSQCVTNGNYWGGAWSLDTEIYHIYDLGYPAHTLPSDLTSSRTSSSSKTTSVIVPAGATTVTTTFSGHAITETFVPTTISGKASTTSSTTIDGVVVPLIIGAGGLAFVPFIPPDGAPPVSITPPSVPNDPTANPTTAPTTTTSSGSTSSSSSSSSSSSATKTPRPADDVYFGGGPGTFDGAIATKTTTFGAMTSSSASSSSTSQSSSAASSTTSTAASTCSPVAFSIGTYTPAPRADCQNISPTDDSNTIIFNPSGCVNYPDSKQKYCSVYTSGQCQISVGWLCSDWNNCPDPVPSNNMIAKQFSQIMGQTPDCILLNQQVSGDVYSPPNNVEHHTGYQVCIGSKDNQCLYVATPNSCPNCPTS